MDWHVLLQEGPAPGLRVQENPLPLLDPGVLSKRLGKVLWHEPAAYSNSRAPQTVPCNYVGDDVCRNLEKKLNMFKTGGAKH